MFPCGNRWTNQPSNEQQQYYWADGAAGIVSSHLSERFDEPAQCRSLTRRGTQRQGSRRCCWARRMVCWFFAIDRYERTAGLMGSLWIRRWWADATPNLDFEYNRVVNAKHVSVFIKPMRFDRISVDLIKGDLIHVWILNVKMCEADWFKGAEPASWCQHSDQLF